MKNFKVFNIKTIPMNFDIVSGAIWELDILGINETPDSLQVTVYEDSAITSLDIKNILSKLMSERLIDDYEIIEETLENKNWNEEWERKTKIIEIGSNIVIKPSFKKYTPKGREIIINIDPKMSFGTGEHQTTKIMLQLCEKFITTGCEVLDIGSGTGILAIAASKFGAESVYAVDNDEWCYINAKENVSKNEVDNIVIMHGTIESIEERKFDVVLANINKNVILVINHSLVNVLIDRGILILSGILLDDLQLLERQFIPLGLTAEYIEKMDEWLGIAFRKS
ncbi:MAG: 50S ribosomal protein L11 methyltransferase [Melioribacteraceae bacterium]|nr:50S ribosomal protein L11 methyltransferase [Melioribacteraceae bacterium]